MEIMPQSNGQRRNMAAQIRRQAALAEKNLGDFPSPTNGDEELYANRIGNFTKTMRHDAIGEVNPADYHLVLQALKSGNFHDWEAIPQGGTGRFLNPLGGLAFNLEGPDSPATTLVSVPFAIASAEKAAEMVELYWEAYLRDVPFADYLTNPVI